MNVFLKDYKLKQYPRFEDEKKNGIENANIPKILNIECIPDF
jgi:hypothetical protein